MKILYVCSDFPYPPRNGGVVDTWNRIKTLHAMGVTLDVLATCCHEPRIEEKACVQSKARRLIIAKREPTRAGAFSYRPAQVAIRGHLRSVEINEEYDFVLMQTQFTADVLLNKTLKYSVAVIRVENDEFTYYIETAKADGSLWRKLYYFQESLKIWWHSRRVLPEVDALWFISKDELDRHALGCRQDQKKDFLPAAIDLESLDSPQLKGARTLFIGNLWTSTNRRAVEWYVRNVHSDLNDLVGYRLVIAGSTQGRGCDWLDTLAKSFHNIEVHYDQEDLREFYQTSAVFINPAREGAGVKLKTIGAVLHGLPVVSTRVGVEGTGLIDDLHFKLAETPRQFCEQIRSVIQKRRLAMQLVSRAQQFIVEVYDQERALQSLLTPLCAKASSIERCVGSSEKIEIQA